MKERDLIPADYEQRLQRILDESWRLFKTRFLDERHRVATEAPFQHYLAHIIATLGDLYCTRRDDLFLVDLETRLPSAAGRRKYVDITCSFPREQVSCALELKFKTRQQGAQDYGRIDAFVDLASLEQASQQEYSFGRFYMITDSRPYVGQSSRGVGTVFTTHDGAVTKPGQRFHCPHCKGREHVVVHLLNSYTFEWERNAPWYFLALHVPKPPSGRTRGR
jgi:hypothetical protein